MKSPIVVLTLSALPVFAGNISPANRYAYDANAGWIDFAPPVTNALTVGNYSLKGYAYSANYGWISFGSGPVDKLAYSSSGADQGVNFVPDSGHLSGLAYAANTGWIRFGWAGSNDPNRARINPVTGVFAGYAYGENTGWMNLSTLKTSSFALSDTDGDSIDDAWEMANFGNLTAAGIGTDKDKDGQSDAAEFIAGTSPLDNTSWLRVTTYSVNSGKTQSSITFTSSPNRLYQIESSTDLIHWGTAPTDIGGADKFPGTANSATTTVSSLHATNTARFFRVTVSKY